MSCRKLPQYNPLQGLIRHALLRVGVPIAVILLCLYVAWLGGTRRERYVRQVADHWHAIRMNTPGMERELEREEIARRRARERERQKTR